MSLPCKLAIAIGVLMVCAPAKAQEVKDQASPSIVDLQAEGALAADSADAVAAADQETDVVTIQRDRSESLVVCRWVRRNGSNFRERRCRSRAQATREEHQADYALRRMTGF